jgi:hypothetical protein
MKWGLILTDARMWEAVADDVRQALDSVTDRVRRKYEGHLDREQEEEMQTRLRGTPDWFGRTTSLLAGVGIGLGVGLLFAPTSGKETREAIRDRAVDLKDRLADTGARKMHIRSSETATGTNGD